MKQYYSQNLIKPYPNYFLWSFICCCPCNNSILNSAVYKTIVKHAKGFPWNKIAQSAKESHASGKQHGQIIYLRQTFEIIVNK